ncbi:MULTISPECIES: hypothetical protein [Paracoccus]|jgi:spermidine synthase|uniref:spermine/spermidine synthase domain-containing protein n=1 Tax=Paracoccus TaxID=265 RepID=UPI001E5F2836|nr:MULTISPECIES: hypothetical protein [Paracoccus]UFS68356.1 hypothetical protein LO749_22330 [Paracoccus denitrificans]
MPIWNTLARADTAAGDEILLRQRGALYEIRFNGLELMSNLNHQSETVLAERSLRLHGRTDARVLIGGLGMGFTLRAALELLGPAAQVTVCELIPQIAGWNRDRIGHLAGHPLRDPRVTLRIADVMEVLLEHRAAFDVILMDTDNGPDFTVRQANGRLYGEGGLAVLRKALRPDGIAAFWSATASDPFERVLDAQPWHWRRDDIQLIGGRVDAFHHIYLASAEAGRIGLRASPDALPALALS